jgi:uncharacterized protein (DUF58 family)
MSWKTKLNTDRIYIIPTRVGALFIGATLIILLIGSAYSNNLINLLAFFMLSLVFVSMVLTNVQLKGIELDSLEIERSFADGEMRARAMLQNQNSDARYGIDLQISTLDSSRSELIGVKPLAKTALRFFHHAPARGRHEIAKVVMSSIYPLGFFYAWKLISTPQSFVIYPAPFGTPVFPPLENALPDARKEEVQTHALEKTLGDDFRGHRLYGLGDSARHIDWRAQARGRPLLVKELNEGGSPDLIFNWDSLTELSSEARLSQLTLWIEEAQRQQLSFRLRLPDFESTDAEKCLTALAVYPESSGT